MATKNINIHQAVPYLRTLSESALDGVYNECLATMARLGIARANGSSDAVPTPTTPGPDDTEIEAPVTGNLRSVIDFIVELDPPAIPAELSRGQKKAVKKEFESQKQAVAMLFDVVRGKMRATKHDPKQVATDETVQATKTAEVKAQRKADRAALRAQRAAEKAAVAAKEAADAQAEADRETRAKLDAEADAKAKAVNQAVADQEAKAKAKRDAGRNKNRKRIQARRDNESQKEADARLNK
jgi:colicin import membrane protein